MQSVKSATTMIGKAERMKTHRTRCLEKENRQKTEARKRDRSPSPVQTDAPPLKQPKLDANIVRTTSDLKQDLDLEIARMFYACNIPFIVVEHPTFKRCFQRARPGYTPPSRKALGGLLLDVIYAENQQKMKKYQNKNSKSVNPATYN